MGAVALDYDVALHRQFRVVAERRESTIWDTRLATPNSGSTERAVVMLVLEGSVTWHAPDGCTFVAPSAFVVPANQLEGQGGRWPRTFRSEGSPFSTVEVQIAPSMLEASDRPRPIDLSAALLAAARAHTRLVHDAAVPGRELRERTIRTLLSTLYEQGVTRTDLSTEVEPPTMLDEQLWRLLAPLVEDFEILPSLATTGAPAGLSARQLTRRIESLLERLDLPWGGWREITRGYRLKVAVMLLSCESLAIADVASRCGYSSAEALAHAHTTEGLPPPNELRRRILGNLG